MMYRKPYFYLLWDIFLNLFIVFLFIVVGVGLIKILTVISAPIALVKTLISVVHLVAASVNIASLDAAERNKDKQG